MWKKMCFIVFSMVFFSGCNATVTENNLSSVHFVKADDLMGDKTPEERASSIKSMLYNIKGISGNAVVVEGHTAIIGLRLEEGMENEATRLSREADTVAKEADKYINNTSITTNIKIVSLIEKMEKKRAG